MERMENNIVEIEGEIIKNFEFSHEVFGEGFYSTVVSVERQSHYFDHIPILVSERLVDVSADWTGQFVFLSGEFRSFNMPNNGKSKIILSLFVKELECQEDPANFSNFIALNGYVCKPPIYRKTPLGRDIAELLLAVNRGYGKSDYIPCICWGRNARFASTFEVGTYLELEGRVQSRDYTKALEDGTTEVRTAFEVSVSKMEL